MGELVISIIVFVAGYYFFNSFGRLNNPNYADEAEHHIGVIIVSGIVLFIILGALIFGGR
jgi:hypothetical protein